MEAEKKLKMKNKKLVILKLNNIIDKWNEMINNSPSLFSPGGTVVVELGAGTVNNTGSDDGDDPYSLIAATVTV